MESPSSAAVRSRVDVGPASAGVSWGAIAAAAFVGAALALILLILGSGLGFSSASPWAGEGASAKTLGIAAVIWLIFTHLASSAVSGYMAGRLRTRWTDVNSGEVYFRDTAHGLAAWAVGIVFTAAFLTSAATSVVSGAAKTAAAGVGAAATAGGAAAAAGAQKTGAGDANAYFVDSLFRSDRPREANDQPVREEATRIFATALQQGDLSAGDRGYLTQLVAARTGMPPPDAERRVNEVMTQAKAAEVRAREAADAARKAAAKLALWTFAALLIGAFTASLAATFGGRLRDKAVVVADMR